MSEENKNIQSSEEVQKASALEAADSSVETALDQPTEEIEASNSSTDYEKKVKNAKTIPLKAVVIGGIAFILAFLMFAYSFAYVLAQKQYNQGFIDGYDSAQTNASIGGSSGYSDKNYIDYLLGKYFFGELNGEELNVESLKAYIAATGDAYAAYYTPEEFDAMQNDSAGKMYGVGINVVNSRLDIDGWSYLVLKIINVMKNSPAEEVGLRPGDMIAYIGINDQKELLSDYDDALTKLKGPDGSVAEFTVLRPNGDKFEEIPVSATRREVISSSAYASVSTIDAKVGIIKITGFELNTPAQFEAAVEELLGNGCEKFVIDLRYNPGGSLISVQAVLSFFLNEGDVYIRTEDKNGTVQEEKVAPVTYPQQEYEACNVDKADIGKYKELNMVVLCNEYTASAGELFTATFKDYGLGTVVGNKTYGKGTMQNTFPLLNGGAVKFTTHKYYSAKTPGYDGIGIEPNVVKDLSEEAKKLNIYDLPNEKDDQFIEAIKYFK